MKLFRCIFPTPYQIKQREFASRISAARKKHKPIRDIKEEQRQWLNKALTNKQPNATRK